MGAAGPTTPHRILVVEDNDAIRDVVVTALAYQGYSVAHVIDGALALAHLQSQPVDLIVLDVMLPRVDGFEVCRRLRAQSIDTPVLFLTARADADDRVRGFATGGDDYLTKPFNVDELLFRVSAILRRSAPPLAHTLLQVGSLTLEPAGHEVRRAGVRADLSATELRLLEYLMINHGVVLSKAQILSAVWGEEFTGSANVVELFIGYLRRKIDDGHPPLIHTLRGAGYVLREDPQ